MENLLEDGRDWLLDTERPAMVDIHACWVFDWAINMSSDMQLSEHDMRSSNSDAVGDIKEVLRGFTRVHEWVERFRWTCAMAMQQQYQAGAIRALEGQEDEDLVVETIFEAGFAEQGKLGVDQNDILRLTHGQQIQVAPVDFGFTHIDKGELVGLSRNEVVVNVKAAREHDFNLRLHFPRINFKVTLIRSDEVDTK